MCFAVYVLIAENRTKRKTALCSVPRQRYRQPNATKATTLKITANLSRPRFFSAKLRTYHMRYIVWRMCSYAFVYFLLNHVAVGKRKVETTRIERPTARTSGVHNDHHRAVCTPHSTLCSSEDSRSLYTAVSFGAFRRVRLTHSAAVSKA